MYTFIIGIVSVVGMYVLLQIPSTTVTEKTMEVVEVKPEWATDEDAVKAAQDVIRKKELKAEQEKLKNEIDERKARITEIEKELGTY